MKDGKKRGAVRLMEALSGVDEDLLERCGQDCRRQIHRGLWQWNMRTAAAVLCLAVAGAVSWGGYQLSNLKMGSSSGGKAQMMATDSEGDGQEAVPEDMEPEEFGAAKEESALDDMADAGGTDMTGQREEAAGGVGKSQDVSTEEGAAEENGSSGADSDGCLPLQSRKLTEAQSREEAVLGAYVPTVLPAGYAFEDAYCTVDDEEANLTVCWSRGMDTIMLHLRKTENPPGTVDVEQEESYDERLYEIPYGETVPEKYRESFDNPVFAAEDFSLEIVESRMKSYDDQGDTDTPRGNFGVLYPDNVLVRFSGRGTAVEIWEMFCSMGGQE